MFENYVKVTCIHQFRIYEGVVSKETVVLKKLILIQYLKNNTFVGGDPFFSNMSFQKIRGCAKTTRKMWLNGIQC